MALRDMVWTCYVMDGLDDLTGISNLNEMKSIL